MEIYHTGAREEYPRFSRIDVRGSSDRQPKGVKPLNRYVMAIQNSYYGVIDDEYNAMTMRNILCPTWSVHRYAYWRSVRSL